MSGIRTVDVGPADVLPGTRAFGDAWRELLADGRSLWAVQTDAGPAALDPMALRRAVQARTPADTPLARLADPTLCVESTDAAAERLRRPGPAALLVASRTGTGATVVERVTPAAREAVVMAGGFGTRLRPLTEDTPKPLLEIGDRPLLCRILAQLRAAGIERVHVSVHYLAERVREAVGDGSGFGLSVDYLEEDEPLGTGAGLALLDSVEGPFVLMNGDILTDIDLAAMVRQHCSSGSWASVATFVHAHPLAYGVVHCEGDRIGSIEEKPVYRYPVNAGIYVFDPLALTRVPRGRPLAMVDFLNELAPEGRVSRFPLVEYWNDVGSHRDYERAQSEVDGLRSW